MEQCIYCRQNTYDKNKVFCATCGKIKSVFNDVIVVYGKEWKNRCPARFALTDKFLIIKKDSNARKGLASSFGLIGAVVASSIDPSKGSPLGYYSLSEIKHIIWPYNNKKLKNNESMKIVNHDGTDLILKGELTCPMFSKIIQLFKECNVTVIDGKSKNFGDTYCEKPFVHEGTVGCRVSPEASKLVCMMKDNFIASAISAPGGVAYATKENAPKKDDGAYSFVPSEKYAVENTRAPRAPEPNTAPAPDPAPTQKTVSEPACEDSGAKEFKFCHECGNKLLRTDKFCPECGTRQR